MSKDENDPKAEPEEVQRWTAKRRRTLTVSIIKGETSPQEAARKHGLTVAEVEESKERFLAGAEWRTSAHCGRGIQQLDSLERPHSSLGAEISTNSGSGKSHPRLDFRTSLSRGSPASLLVGPSFVHFRFKRFKTGS
jgi:hypothetical protein